MMAVAQNQGCAERRAAFHRSAAVLWQFEPDALEPDDDQPAAPGEARALLRLDVARLRTPRGDAWTLKDALRRPVLRGAAPGDLAALRARNPAIASREQALVDRWLVGPDPELASYDFNALAVVARLVTWFDPPPAHLPSAEEIDRLRARARVREPLDRLGGVRFRGRARELERLRRLAAESRILVVHGPSGVGKSTLTARVVLDGLAAGDPADAFAYIDLDGPGEAVSDGVGLIAELARQLSVQRPDAAGVAHAAARAALTVAELARGGGGPGHALARVASSRELAAQLGAALRATGIGRVTLMLDTFDDTPYPSADRVRQLGDQLGVLDAHLPGLHAIVVSRVPLALPGAAALELGALDPESAETYVRELGVKDDAAVRAVLDLGGADPLSLWLAATVVAGGGALDPALAAAPTGDAQRALCRQLVAQVHPPETQRLIYPGLVVRRITCEILRQVLAGPCRLGDVTEARALELMTQLGREVALVRCASDGAIEARSQVRQLLLAELGRDQPGVVRELHARAAAYHDARDDESSVAEAAYHHFALGELHGPWLDRLTPRSGDRLRGALDELPERAWPVVASYAGIDIPPERLTGATPDDLEHGLARRLEALLRDDRVEDALALISRSQPPQLSGSELWRWEARVLRLAGRPRSALAAFERSLAEHDGSTPAARADHALAIALAEELHDGRALTRLGPPVPAPVAPPAAAPAAPAGAGAGTEPWLDDHALRVLVADAIDATSRSVTAAQSAAAPVAPAAAATLYTTAARLNRTPRAPDGSVPLQAWVDTLPGVHLYPPIDDRNDDPGDGDHGLS